MKSEFLVRLITLFILLGVIDYSCKDNKENGGDNAPENQKVLLIENGPQALYPGDKVNFTAVFVNGLGEVSPATVNWSVDQTSIATITAAGELTAVDAGETSVKASVTGNGKTYNAEVPVGVHIKTLFEVVPGAVIWELDAGTIPLLPVYYGNQNPTFTFESSDNSIATVSSTGEISFHAVGSCTIHVTSDLPGNPVINVPVLVVGEPEIELPVTKVTLEPKVTDLFRNETQQFTAHAFNSNGDEVSTDFSWSIENPFDEDLDEVIEVATVNDGGLVSAKRLGKATLTVVAKGFYAQSKIIVNPDTILIVDPVYTSVAPGKSRQLVSTPYKLNHNKTLTEITDPVDFTWFEFGDLLNDFSIDQNGLISVDADANPGNIVSILAIPASATINPGFSIVMVGIASDCDCGEKLAEAVSIEVEENSFNLQITSFQTGQINASVLDGSNSPITSAAINYCSDNEQIATVDSDGLITPISQGTATITVCHGELTTEVTVNVSL